MSKEAIVKLEKVVEALYQKVEGFCPWCGAKDYPVCGDKKGYEEVKAEDAEEWHIEHHEDCIVVYLDQALEILKKPKDQPKTCNCVNSLHLAGAVLCPDCQQTNSEFIEGARAFLLRQGANDEQWEFATLLRKACDRFDRATQQPISELTKESIELDKMCVSEIVAKYESSHNAITVLKRKFLEACESDEWMKSATEFYENGGCPICFSTDEAGCTKGCYLGSLMQQRKDLLEALKNLLEIDMYRDEFHDAGRAAIAKAEKEG